MDKPTIYDGSDCKERTLVLEVYADNKNVEIKNCPDHKLIAHSLSLAILRDCERDDYAAFNTLFNVCVNVLAHDEELEELFIGELKTHIPKTRMLKAILKAGHDAVRDNKQ